LTLYTEEAFGRLAAKLEAGSPTGQDVRDFSRLFYAQAHRVELDGQGRFRIPEELFQLARLEQEVMLIGVGDHMELWNVAAWESYLSERQQRYDEIAERAFRAGG
jgi:MraZ protein